MKRLKRVGGGNVIHYVTMATIHTTPVAFLHGPTEPYSQVKWTCGNVFEVWAQF